VFVETHDNEIAVKQKVLYLLREFGVDPDSVVVEAGP
jgi:hypothetical protein